MHHYEEYGNGQEHSHDHLLSVDLAAMRAKVSYATLQRYIAMGTLAIAKRGPRGQLYLDARKIDEWRMWYLQHRDKVKENRRRRFSALAKANGMMAPGQLPCEEQDESDRDRLFLAARGTDKIAARAALKELYQKYNGLRLPLEEQRVGFSVINSCSLDL